jgi:hypothetical protein
MKIWLLVIILLFSSSCKNENKEEGITSKNISANYEPIFLNLSPKMEEMRFYEELNKNPSIKNGFFYIPLNEKTTSFKVSKMEDRILLEYNGKTQVSNSTDTANTPFWERAYINNKKTVQEFIDLFKSKYGKSVNLLPFEQNNEREYFNREACWWKNAINQNSRRREHANGILNKTLWDYDFDKCSYLIFQDNSKTIMIGYENSNSNDFGVELEINYFHNSDFEKLSRQMRKDKSDFETAKKIENKIENEEQDLLNKNKDKI